MRLEPNWKFFPQNSAILWEFFSIRFLSHQAVRDQHWRCTLSKDTLIPNFIKIGWFFAEILNKKLYTVVILKKECLKMPFWQFLKLESWNFHQNPNLAQNEHRKKIGFDPTAVDRISGTLGKFLWAFFHPACLFGPAYFLNFDPFSTLHVY